MPNLIRNLSQPGVGRMKGGREGEESEDKTERFLFVQLCTRVISPARRVWDVRSRGGHAWIAPTYVHGFIQLCSLVPQDSREKKHPKGSIFNIYRAFYSRDS